MIDGANAHSRILACWLAAGLVTAGCGGSPSDLQLLPGGQGDASEDAGDVPGAAVMQGRAISWDK